jgi:hypothetical protein
MVEWPAAGPLCQPSQIGLRVYPNHTHDRVAVSLCDAWVAPVSPLPLVSTIIGGDGPE